MTKSHSYRAHHLTIFGEYGFDLPISVPRQSTYDFTIMLAFRISELRDHQQVLFDNKDNGPMCSLAPKDEMFIECNSGQRIDLKLLPDLNAWIQLTYVADSRDKTSMLRVDQSSVNLTSSGSFMQIKSSSIFLGIKSDLTLHSGLVGDLREFYMNAGKATDDAIPVMMHNVKVFEGSAMAYFQFNPDVGILSDSFRDLTGSVVKTPYLLVNKLPILYIDEGSKLVCDELDMNPTIDLPLFTSDFESQKVKIPNFKFMQTQYQYTLSMWMRSTGTHTFSTKELEGTSNQHFVLLENVFALWFDSPTSFRVYIFSSKDYLEESTSSISFPLHQWVNIQLEIDQKQGLKVALYSQSGDQLKLFTLPASSLPEQIPSGNIELFKNFNGEAMNLKLWLKRFSIPVNTDASDMLIDLDFRSSNYEGNQFTTKGAFVLPAKNLQFFNVKAPTTVNYKNPSTLGHFNSLATLWDGSGCDSTMQNLVYVDQGPISSQFEMAATKAMTVEFWFKFKNLPDQNATFNLHSLQTSNQNKWSLTIYVEKGVLKCAPFGKSSDQILEFKNVSTEQNWQYVSCGFTHQLQAIGQYLAYNTSQILPDTYGRSLINSTERTPNYLIDLEFTSQLGSTIHSCYFRDVRVWNEMRTIEQLYTNRFKQLNSMTTTGLELNYKLVDGNLSIVNEAKRGSAVVSGNTPSLEMSKNDDLVICASDRYFDPMTASCYQTPYMSDLPLVYTAKITEQHGLQLSFTNEYKQSNLLLPSMQPHVKQIWTIDDASIYSTSVKQQNTMPSLLMNPYTLGDGYKYQIGQLQQATDHSFWQNITQTFYPRKCLYLADTETLLPYNQVTTTRQVGTTPEQKCFTFSVNTVDGCYGDFYNQFRDEVTVESSPHIPNLQSLTQFTVNTDQQSVQACLPVNLIQSVAANEPLNLIFSVYWSTDKITLPQWSFINTVYQLIVVDEIDAKLATSIASVDFDQTVTLNASESTFKGSQSRAGLYYRWRCPIEFQELCEMFEGSPVIQITPDAFKSSAGTSLTSYKFSIEVHNFKSGAIPLSQDQIFTASVNLIWAAFAAPEFDIVVPLLLGQTVPKVVSSQDVSLTVDIKNYRASDPRLSYLWELTPAATGQFLNTSIDGSVLTLYEGALKPNTTYSLKVSISNTLQGNNNTGVNYLDFTTGTPPKQGSLFVTPATGIMFQTNFVIFLTDWVSVVGGDLRVNVWGETQIEPKKLIQIGSSMQTLPEDRLQLPPYSLPLILAVQVDVYDLIGEKTTLNKTITVTKPSGYNNWLSVTFDIVNKYNSEDLLEQKYLYFAFVSQNCNNDFNQNDVDASDCLDAIAVMLRQATIDVFPISSDDSSAKAAFVASSVVTMLKEVSAFPETMNSTVGDWTISLLQSISGKVYVFETAMKDPAFQQDFLQTIGNLIVFETSVITPILQQGRRLQSTPQGVINALIVLKNIMLDQLCALPSSSTVLASNMHLITEQFSINDMRKDLSVYSQLDATIVSLPIDELLRTSQDFDSLTTSVCLQISFMATNPVPKYTFSDQEVLDITFLQVSSLDDQQNRVLLSNGLTDLQLNPVRIYTPLDFNSQGFKENQTVCMAYNANSNTPSPWTDNKCQTNYTNLGIVCTCQNLNNYYYGLVNDLTRDTIEVEQFDTQFTWPFLVILVLMLLILPLPCIGLWLDKQDQEAVEMDNKYTVTDELITELVMKRTYSCSQVIFYKLKDIEEMQNMKQFGFCQAYGLISANFHPILSFYRKFDYKYKRLVRASILMLQVTIISLLTIAAYARGSMLENDEAPYVVTFIFGVFCLPVPQTILWVIRSALKVVVNPQNITPDPEVVIEDHCLVLRVLLVAFSVIVYLFTMLMMTLFMIGAEQDEYSFRVDENDSETLLVVWLAAHICGYFILNGVRIIFVSVVAYCRALQIKQAEDLSNHIAQVKQKSLHTANQQTADLGLIPNQTEKIAVPKPVAQPQPPTEESSFLYWLIPYESVELCLDAMYTIDIVENLKNNPASKLPKELPLGDQTHDIMFETNKTNNDAQKQSSEPSQPLNTSQISAEMTDLSARSNYSVPSKVPTPINVKLQKQQQEEVVSDIDIDADLKSDGDDYIASYKKPKKGSADSDDDYDPYGLPQSARYAAGTSSRQNNAPLTVAPPSPELKGIIQQRRGTKMPSKVEFLDLADERLSSDRQPQSMNGYGGQKRSESPEVVKKEKKQKKHKKHKKSRHDDED